MREGIKGFQRDAPFGVYDAEKTVGTAKHRDLYRDSITPEMGFLPSGQTALTARQKAELRMFLDTSERKFVRRYMITRNRREKAERDYYGEKLMRLWIKKDKERLKKNPLCRLGISSNNVQPSDAVYAECKALNFDIAAYWALRSEEHKAKKRQLSGWYLPEPLKKFSD